MSAFDNFLNLALEGLVAYKNSTRKNYENIQHILREDCEILTPSNNEMYVFDIKAWDFIKNDEVIIMTKKESKKKEKNNDNSSKKVQKFKNDCIDVNCIVK